MAIKFSVHQTPQPKDRKEEALCHARAIPNGTKRMDDICALICERGSISSADVKAVLDSLVWVIRLSLEYGDHVELEELGHFSPSLRSRKLPNGKFTVSVDGVNFRCSEKLKNQLKYVKLEKGKETAGYLPKERKNRMVDYLKRNETITTPIYAALNACSHYRAKADLDQYIKENVIVRVVSSTHVSYLLTENVNRE